MSINTAHADGRVLIFNGEIILLYSDGVEFTIEGVESKEIAGTMKGRIYLTTHRMIFVNKNEKHSLQSFSFPFFSMTALELEQPVFGANYIKGLVHAQAGGNWTGKATFKLKFFSGGAIEFGQAMQTTASMASRHMAPPPPYTPYQGAYYPAPPPAYMAPAGGVNGFVPPTHAFPDAPPANSVYTMDMPPPYPGIYPPAYAYPPGSGMYPQASKNGIIERPPAGPAPPGFNPGVAGGAYPPPYNPDQQQMAPGATGQYNGAAQQPPSNEKATAPPPLYDFYENPYDPSYVYANTNGHQGPPPPYSDDKKDK